MAPREQLTSLERAIVAKARRFEVRPLLRLLRSLGYERSDVHFQSNPEQGSQSSLVESVEFERRPMRRAKVTLNLGLLGGNGLLPSYFQQTIEQSPDPDVFYDFIHFFDHKLLDSFMEASYPEDNPQMYGEWGRVRGFFFNMLGVGSVSTLQWLFQLYFPELLVHCTRRSFKSATSNHAARTGVSMLDGTGVIGRNYESDSPGFKVTIFTTEEVHDNGEAWPHIVRARLRERVLPLLAPYHLPLTVILHVTPHASWATLDKEGFLGFERLRGDEAQGHQIGIYYGRTGADEV